MITNAGNDVAVRNCQQKTAQGQPYLWHEKTVLVKDQEPQGVEVYLNPHGWSLFRVQWIQVDSVIPLEGKRMDMVAEYWA